jgi:lipoyl(octanoyl) transferase
VLAVFDLSRSPVLLPRASFARYLGRVNTPESSSSVASSSPTEIVGSARGKRLGKRLVRLHEEQASLVNARGALPVGLKSAAGDEAVEWHVSNGLVDYERAVSVMTARAGAVAQRTARELVWLLEHPPLYTAGPSARPEEVIDARFPVFTTSRGGRFTYHGPGQRVAYLILDLNRRAPDIRRYVATLEEWIIRTLSAFEVRGERREDRVGVWVSRPGGREDKIAAIGIKVRRFVTFHGISLNVDPNLAHFAGIVPCGVSGPRFGVTSLADLGHRVRMAEVDDVLRREFEALFGAAAEGVGDRSRARAGQDRDALAACPQNSLFVPL